MVSIVQSRDEGGRHSHWVCARKFVCICVPAVSHLRCARTFCNSCHFGRLAAVICFQTHQVLESLGVTPGVYCDAALSSMDKDRIKKKHIFKPLWKAKKEKPRWVSEKASKDRLKRIMLKNMQQERFSMTWRKLELSVPFSPKHYFLPEKEHFLCDHFSYQVETSVTSFAIAFAFTEPKERFCRQNYFL